MLTEGFRMLTVEAPDESSRGAFQSYVETVLAESTIRGAIKGLYVYVNPNEPVFIIYAYYALSGKPIKVSEAATIRQLEKGVSLTIDNDSYMPKLLRALFNKYGKDKVSQPSRYEIVIEKEINTDELSEIVIQDPKEDLLNRIIDTLTRMIPEGMRVRSSTTYNSRILIVASEDPIKSSWLDKSQEIIKKVESLEREERI